LLLGLVQVKVDVDLGDSVKVAVQGERGRVVVVWREEQERSELRLEEFVD
jgi:hypothetical protein